MIYVSSFASMASCVLANPWRGPYSCVVCYLLRRLDKSRRRP